MYLSFLGSQMRGHGWTQGAPQCRRHHYARVGFVVGIPSGPPEEWVEGEEEGDGYPPPGPWDPEDDWPEE